MTFRYLCVTFLMSVTLPVISLAQQPLQDRWPTEDQQKQMQSGQGVARPAKQTAAPTQSSQKQTVAPSHGSQTAKRAEPPRVVVCGGVFAKDSSHLKLAEVFEAQNITYGEVDGPEGTKLMASVLYPKDPKLRLEVLWQNEATRSDLSVISINGQSTWIAPKGLKLGVSLVTLEKLNGKPFKLAGFDWDYGGSVRDWMGGALSTLPGGCAMGMKLTPDPKISAATRSQVSGDKEFMSSDPLMRAANPTVEEITIGYPQ
jgi:hypothetical protein